MLQRPHVAISTVVQSVLEERTYSQTQKYSKHFQIYMFGAFTPKWHFYEESL